jgi:hypothetical protein
LFSCFVCICCPAALKQQLLEQGAASSADIMAGSHCLSRACLRASVAASLAALRLETIDLLYLHNAAEVQLLARGKLGFKEVLKSAFQELEALRQEVLATTQFFSFGDACMGSNRCINLEKSRSSIGGVSGGIFAVVHLAGGGVGRAAVHLSFKAPKVSEF